MTAAAVVLCLAGVLWGGILVARGSLLAGCGLFLIAAGCFGYEFVHFDVGPLPLTIDRLVVAGLVAAYGVQRFLNRAEPKPLQAVDYLLGAFAALLCVSTLGVDFMHAGPGRMPPIVRLVIGYLMPVSVYWVARQSAINERSLTTLYRIFLGFGVYLGITAVLEIAGAWALVFPRYIADPTIGLHFGRARGPMVQSVSLGLALAVCSLCTWLLWDRMSRAGQLLIVCLTPLLLLATFLTYTRSAWIGLAGAIVILLACALQGRARTVVLGGLVAAALLLGVTQLDSILGFQRELTVADTRKSVSMRGSFTYVSWQMFQDRPLLGFGFDQFYREKLPYLSDRSTDLRLEEIRGYIHHNTLLSLLTEVGIVGLSLFLAILSLWARSAWKLWKNVAAPHWARLHGLLTLGALGAYCCPLVFHELSYNPFDNSLIFLVAGIAAGLQTQYSPAREVAASEPYPAGGLAV